MDRERKCCPRSSRFGNSRDFETETHSIKGERSLRVLEAAGRHASVSADSGTDKIKPTCPKGAEQKARASNATTLTLVLEGMV